MYYPAAIEYQARIKNGSNNLMYIKSFRDRAKIKLVTCFSAIQEYISM